MNRFDLSKMTAEDKVFAWWFSGFIDGEENNRFAGLVDRLKQTREYKEP